MVHIETESWTTKSSQEEIMKLMKSWIDDQLKKHKDKRIVAMSHNITVGWHSWHGSGIMIFQDEDPQ